MDDFTGGDNLDKTVSIYAAGEILSLRHDRLYNGGPRDSITAAKARLYDGGTSDSITPARETLSRDCIMAAGETLSRRQERPYRGGKSDSNRGGRSDSITAASRLYHDHGGKR